MLLQPVYETDGRCLAKLRWYEISWTCLLPCLTHVPVSAVSYRCSVDNVVLTCELKLFQKIISEAHCSRRIFSNMFNVAEIFFEIISVCYISHITTTVFLTFEHSGAQGWAPECSNVRNTQVVTCEIKHCLRLFQNNNFISRVTAA